MTGTSSEWSEEAPGADILDLDRYMRGTRPARRPQRDMHCSDLVVDGGAVGRELSSSCSSASEPSDKRFSHDSGLSDTSYRRASPDRRNAAPSVTKNDADTRRRENRSGSEAPRPRGKSSAVERRDKSGGDARRGKSSGESRRGKSGGETRRGKSIGESRRGKSGGETRRGKSGGETRRGKSGGKARRGKSSGESKRDKSSEESRRGKSSEESRRGKSSEESRRGKSGSEVERRSSGTRSSFRESLERTLRDQQAQIARVVQMCELQARSSPSERHSERRGSPSERRGRPSERRSDKRSDKRSERPTESGQTSSYSTEFSSSSSSIDPLKRRNSECRTYKIIMSKLDELNRLFVARRAPPAPAALPAPARASRAARAGRADSARGDSSVTVSDKFVGTEAPRATNGRPDWQTRQKPMENDHNRTIIVAAASVDIPPAPRFNALTESVVRNEREISAPASEKGMPGQFHLDDPVRLYQQAKRLEARERRSDSSSSSGSGARGSDKGAWASDSGAQAPDKGARAPDKAARAPDCGARAPDKGARAPSLCALCRCYWLVARRYVAQLNPVRE